MKKLILALFLVAFMFLNTPIAKAGDFQDFKLDSSVPLIYTVEKKVIQGTPVGIYEKIYEKDNTEVSLTLIFSVQFGPDGMPVGFRPQAAYFFYAEGDVIIQALDNDFNVEYEAALKQINGEPIVLEDAEREAILAKAEEISDEMRKVKSARLLPYPC